ncbi:hypothetical protein GWI33_019297 [Rhynchophorus ferrugineus]|uniref:C2H2-type domain-containing protein n=1 Tax=Rhynchophorus ferrugineus TaxID=354439 RepID=A0A834HYI0_RHYFE|nr:hypothetical protein GWI33_019297 [Rhynchophorus ferrugineus]
MDKFENVCCICIQKAELLTSLNNADGQNVKYMDKLSCCVPKETWIESYQLCSSCISQLDSAYAFVQTCIENELFRKQNLQQIENDTGNCDLNDIRDLKYVCDYCNKSFRQKKYLNQHITKSHSNVIKKEKEDLVTNECSLEGKKSDLKTEVESNTEFIKFEQNKENQDGELVDSDIDDPKANLDDYVDNCSSYSEPEIDNKPTKPKIPKKISRQCTLCPEIFPTRHDWIVHIRMKHTVEKPFACEECDARYLNEYSLLIHKRKHTNEKPYVCATCGKSFFSSADLNHHNKTHNADRAYQCLECERSFKTHSNLRTHRLQMHLDPSKWEFLCNLCDKKFPIRGNLVKHLKRHSGVKEFDCHVCGKRFINKAELKLHLNTHTNQRNFECKWCTKDYKNREGLRRHLKVVHGEGNWKPPKSEKRFLCPMCPKVFAFSNKLQRHICTHTGEKPYKCDYCQKRFIDNYGRKVHYKKDHNLDI